MVGGDRKFTGNQNLVWISGLILLISFFLPWVDLGIFQVSGYKAVKIGEFISGFGGKNYWQIYLIYLLPLIGIIAIFAIFTQKGPEYHIPGLMISLVCIAVIIKFCGQYKVKEIVEGLEFVGIGGYGTLVGLIGISVGGLLEIILYEDSGLSKVKTELQLRIEKDLIKGAGESQKSQKSLLPQPLKPKPSKIDSNYIICPKCGFENWKGYLKCQMCDTKFLYDRVLFEKEQRFAHKSINKDKEKPSIFCTQCGFKNESDSNFCQDCGSPLE